MSNYTKYPTDLFIPNIETRTPAKVQAIEVDQISANLTWTPILGAESYTLYKDGVPILEEARDVGAIVAYLFPGGEFTFTVVANAGGKSSPHSLPLVVNVPEPIGAQNARFVSIVETARNSRVWVLSFDVTFVYEDGSTVVRTLSINLNGNNANLDGRFVFPADHLLAGYTLNYDIKGNGSNIKTFNLR